MSQAASASLQKTAIDEGGRKTNKNPNPKIQILVEPPKRVLQYRFKILVRFTPKGPFPGSTQHEDDTFLQLFTWSALWYTNCKKKSPLQSWGVVHLFSVGADLDCASAGDKAAHTIGWEAYGHNVLIHAYCGGRFEISRIRDDSPPQLDWL